MDQSQFNDRLKTLREQYQAGLGEKADELARDWQALRADPDARDRLDAMILQSHSLAGSGAVFGLPELSRLAKDTEDLLRASIAGGQPLYSRTVTDHIQALIDTLRSHTIQAGVGAGASDQAANEPQTDSLPRTDAPTRFLALVQDSSLYEELDKQLGQYGFELLSADSPAAALLALQAQTMQAAILELTRPDDTLATTLRELREAHRGDLPVLLISHAEDFDARLQAVRAGINAYFTYPVDTHRIFDAIDALTQGKDTDPYRVMVVDDSLETARYYTLLLERAGMKTRVVTAPGQAMEAIADFNPELIILDVYMPEVSGPELAAVIRQQDNFVGMPIVFLSSETDKSKQLLALAQGADDFLTKPIIGEHLVTAVRNRIERYRHLRSFMTRDSLTGLLNHTTLTEQLENELARANRQHGQLAFAMLDIDHFKRINDSYGHPTGDRVLKDLSRLLRQRLRRSDIIGRYGGEEFAVILTDTDAQTAASVMDDLRQAFAAMQHRVENDVFTVTLSCGIAAFPDYTQSVALTDAADRALYESKHAGRNRITLAE